MQTPAPYSERIEAAMLVALSEEGPHLLLSGDPRDVIPGSVLHKGACLLRYGFAYLYRAEATLIPRWVMDDFRQEYSGIDALRFLREQGDSFPRGDVIGTLLPEGTNAEAFIKEVDLARPLRVFAYEAETGLLIARVHVAVQVDAALEVWQPISGTDGPFPALLRESLPCYGIPAGMMARLPELVLSIFK